MIDKLLSELRHRDIRIWSEGDRLRYDAPRGALSPELRAQLKANKKAILERLADLARVATERPVIERADRENGVLLSFAQRSMWLLWKLAPHSPAYDVPTVIKFTGPLNVSAVRQSLRAIQARHEVLRTRIVEGPDEPLQVADETSALTLPLVDLTRMDADRREARARDAVRQEASTPFDLSTDVPIAATLYKLADTTHWLFFKLHHIAYDGWSNTILLRDFFSGYEALARGGRYELEPMSIQYADFAAWQRQHYQGPVRQRLLSYWTRQVGEGIVPLELPTDRPRPISWSTRGDHYRFRLPAALATQLGELCRQQNATMFMVLLAGFRVLLARYSGQTDFLIATPSTWRSRPETEPLIGYFGNTLVLRNALKPDDSYRDLIERERQTALEGYEHQELPFEALVEELAQVRASNTGPLFRVMFLFGERNRDVYELPELTVEFDLLDTKTSKFDLLLWVEEVGDELVGEIEFATELFDRSTIARMAAHLCVIYEDMAATPDSLVRETCLLTAAERRTLLERPSDDGASHDVPRVHELFETQAEATPGAIALRTGQRESTYAELNVLANRRAALLRQHGVSSRSLVGVCLRRSEGLVAALLGVLKAGCAYVPIDPKYPAERIRLILADSGVDFVLTEPDFIDRLPADNIRPLICDDSPTTSTAPPNPQIEVGPGDLAYVLYTSGSTGQPKGVAIEHRNVSSLLSWAVQNYARETLAGVLAGTSVCFDLSVFELFVPLCCGGAVVLADDALKLPGLPAKDCVTLVNTVPSVMQTLLASSSSPLPESVRVVNLAGELLDTQLVDELYRRTSVEKVYDLYGPTEATTYATRQLRRPERAGRIGRPISGTRAYVLDGAGNPAPIGVVGELYLAGNGLARGYLSDPDLTSERFWAPRSPLVRETRLYRTGDLARLHPSGELEYCGRIDQQVQIRGYRVEPAEVAAALQTMDGVTAAKIVGRRLEGGETILAGYFIADERCTPTEARRHLQTRLPTYMVPARLLRVEQFPIGPNGKLDLGPLDDPDASRATKLPRPPQTETEKALADIWRSVLGIERVDTLDSFFDLGGHSLKAMLVTSRINAALGIELPLSAIFEQPTIHGLAALVEQAAPGGSELPPILRMEFHVTPLTQLQHQLWMTHHIVREPSFLNIRHTASFGGEFDLPRAERALRALVSRHPILGARFLSDGEQVWQHVSDEPVVEICVEDLSEESPSEHRETMATIEYHASRPFDLSEGGCARFVLVRLSANHHKLMAVIHHIVVDEWALALLIREFSAIYDAQGLDTPIALPPPELTFGDYALWERTCCMGRHFEGQLEKWREVLSPPLERMTFPWRTKGDSRQTELISRPLVIDADLSSSLLDVARGEQTSLFVALLSALERLLHRHTGATDIRICTNVARRQLPGSENIVGPLADSMIIRTDMLGKDSALSALRAVRRSFLSVWNIQDVPFESIATYLLETSRVPRQHFARVFYVFHEMDAPIVSSPAVEPGDDDAYSDTAVERDFFKSALHDYDLILYLQGGAAGMRGQLTVRTDPTHADIVDQLLAEYRQLLTSLVIGHGASNDGDGADPPPPR